MTATWIYRRDFPMPYQDGCPFPPCAIVQVRNAYGDSQIGPASSFWWGYEVDMGFLAEGVIFKARRLDRPKP